MTLGKVAADITKTVTQSVKTTGVVNVLVILVAIVTPLSLVLLLVSSGWRAVVFLGFAGLPIVSVIVAYVYFARYNPSFLRSENYQFRREALNLLGDKYRPITTLKEEIISVPATIEGTPQGMKALPPPDSEKINS